MSRRGLGLLLLDVTDIEQKAAHATLLALAEHARLQAVPGIAIASSQTQALNERLATVSQSAQAHAQLVAVARMYPLQPGRQTQARLLQRQLLDQRRCQLQLLAVRQKLPPAGAEQALQGTQAILFVALALMRQTSQQCRGDGREGLQPVALKQP